LPLRRETWLVIAIAAASLALRLAMAVDMDVFQDEAYYWWGAQWGLMGFCPHPPGTSVAVWAGTQAFGDTLLGLRVGSLAWGTGAIVLACALGRELYGPRAGLWAAALLAACPLFMGIGAITTPDSLLVFLWLLFLWSVRRAATGGGGRWWLLSGLVLAAGLYTKYIMVLALPAAFVALIATREGRGALRTPWPWAAAGIGLALFLPVFAAWNWSLGWPSIRYHLVSRHIWDPEWERVGRYVLTHAGALSPVLFVAALGALLAAARAWRRGDARGPWLLAFGAFPILFFLPPSVLTEHQLMQVQWDEFGYAVGMVALGGIVGGEAAPRMRWRRLLGAGALALACLESAVLLIGLLWPAGCVALGVRPPGLQQFGWREAARRVQAVQAREKAEFIATDSFAAAMSVGFHLGRRDGIYTLPHPRNERYGLVEQLDAWRMDAAHLVREHRGRDGLFVREDRCYDRCECGKEPRTARQFFREVRLVDAEKVFVGGKMMRCIQLFRARSLASSPLPH